MKYTQYIILSTLLIIGLNCNAQYSWEEIIISDSTEVYMSSFDSTGGHYIATNNGVFFSEEGDTWEPTGLMDFVSYIYINECNVIYAGMAYLYRSLDDGISWDSIFYSYEGGIMSVCTIGDSTIFIGTWGGIFRSLDSGQTWALVLDTYNTEVFNDITCDSNGNFFAGSISFDGTLSPGGIYKSIDNGDTWTLIGLDYHFVSSIGINTDDKIFAGTRGHWYNGGGGVFKSIDNGSDWDTMYFNNLVTSITLNEFDNLAFGCSSQGVAIGGVFVSYDDGLNWEDISNNLPSRDIYKLNFGKDNHLYAITHYEDRLFRTDTPVNINETTVNLNQSNHIKISPNPFLNNTIISYDIEYESGFRIEIFNTDGRLVKSVSEINKPRGSYSYKFDAAGLPRGIYFCSYSTDGIPKGSIKMMKFK